MIKKNVVILVILTNVISVNLTLLLLSYIFSQQEKPVIAPVSNEQPSHTPQVEEKPKQTDKMQIDSLMEQFDVIKSGYYQQAIENYKQIIRQDPPYTADSTLGYTYVKLGDYEKAIKLCEENIQEHPYPADYYTLAWIYAKIGKYEDAIAVSNKTAILYPDYSRIWLLLAWTYARQGKNDKAIDACNKALELDPDSALSHYGLGRINVILGESEKAIKSYKKAVQLKSDFEEAYLFLGLAYAELGNQERTIDSYRQAILFDKYYPEPYFFLGIVYDESGQYKKAIESFEQAITWYNSEKTRIRINSMGIKPDLTTIYCIIGACYLRIGQALEASFAFKDSIEVDESHAEAHYGLALAYVLLDKKDEAFEEYEAVKSLKGEQFAKPLFDIIQSTGSIERKR